MLLCAQNLIKIFLERARSDLRGEEKQQQNVDYYKAINRRSDNKWQSDSIEMASGFGEWIMAWT